MSYNIGPGCQCYKTFFFVTDILAKYARVFVNCKYFLASPIFVSKPRSQTKELHTDKLSSQILN
jgi:hypothetical protein